MKIGWISQALLVGSGGFVGAVLRHAVSVLVHRLAAPAVFPYGTLTVNSVGCLGIGLMAGIAESKHMLGPEWRLFLVIGLLGGFTTFSTFGYETVALLRDSAPWRAAANVVLQVVVGLLMVGVGYFLTRP